MTNKIKLLDKNLPLRAYPKEKLQEMLEGDFLIWLSDLLGLTGETSAKRLLNALPAIEKHFWSLGFSEIKKAFIMYADGELKTQPIPNYFTRILVGQIFKEYKQQKPITKKEIKMPEPTQEEKDFIVYSGVVFCFDNYVQTQDIVDGQIWVHDHLMELGLMEFTEKEKKSMWDRSKDLVEVYSKSLDYESAKDLLAKIHRGDQTLRKLEYKKLRLKKYFNNLHFKKQHIKEFLG